MDEKKKIQDKKTSDKKASDKKLSNNSTRGLLIIIAWVIIMGAVVAYIWIQNIQMFPKEITQDYTVYEKHFVLIQDSGDDAFWDSVYNSAFETGKENGILVERFGTNLAVNYTKQELLRMAIQASVDGILVSGDESAETIALIDEAVAKGIPVITILNDSTGSARQGYAGVNNYNIGQEYGAKIIELLGTDLGLTKQHVRVIVDAESENANYNLVLLGIRETIEEAYGTDLVIVDVDAPKNKDEFAMEEYMRELFLEEESLPDVIVCLDSISTSLAYQAAVDYNGVGECLILGNYDSDAILSAVSKGVISYTLSLNTEQMGHLAVEALVDYFQMGYMNNYMPVDMQMIGSDEADRILSENGGGDSE